MTYLQHEGPSLAEPGLSAQTFIARFLNACHTLPTEELRPEAITHDCLRIVRDGDTYQLLSMGEIVIGRTRKNQRPSKLGRSKAWEARDARELLDELVTPGSDAFRTMLDSDVWQCSLRYARENRLDGSATIYLSRAINLLLITRAGGSISAADIP